MCFSAQSSTIMKTMHFLLRIVSIRIRLTVKKLTFSSGRIM
ncbi:Uncharacterised protein [Mycobacteroides abscessus subsp. abscessus]|nr:Uncharacterised protein [Mycobacteroides abscessus subsp. abscessus]